MKSEIQIGNEIECIRYCEIKEYGGRLYGRI